MPQATSAGALDPSFGNGGPATLDAGRAWSDRAGNAGHLGGLAAVLARLTPVGTLDPGFGTGGIAYSLRGQTATGFEAVAIQADGQIVAGGGRTRARSWRASTRRARPMRASGRTAWSAPAPGSSASWASRLTRRGASS